jgi:HAD superfamily hydrolase (TIGR01458 family)
MGGRLDQVDGVLIDIDGVLTVGWSPIAGAVEALARLRSAGVPFRLVTNTTELSRRELVAALHRAGFDVRAEEVITAAVMTAEYLRANHPGAGCFVLGGSEGAEDLEGIRIVGEGADVVVIGGSSRAFSFEEMNHALRLVLGGAALVGMHGAISWMTEEGMALDPGVVLLRGLEAATGRVAVVCGKPSGEAFASALRLLGLAASRVAMVGDDIETDVLAAQAAGLTGVLVRTGKFRHEALDRSSGRPDLVLGSIAELPEALLS